VASPVKIPVLVVNANTPYMECLTNQVQAGISDVINSFLHRWNLMVTRVVFNCSFRYLQASLELLIKEYKMRCILKQEYYTFARLLGL
jgi:hypothetical protein